MNVLDSEYNILRISEVHKDGFTPSVRHIKDRWSDCFAYILEGEADYVFGEKTHRAKAGNIVFLAHHSDYVINITKEKFTFIFIDLFFENPNNIPLENDVYQAKSLAALENKFETFYRLWRTGDFAQKAYCKSLIYQIYSKIIDSKLTEYVSFKNRSKIERIVEYISNHLDDYSLNIKSLSQQCEISEVHFRRIFKQIYHISPIKFITSLRLKKSKELLLDNSIKIGDIAKQCGFENQYYFSKIFKAENQLTPSEFRNFHSQKPL